MVTIVVSSCCAIRFILRETLAYRLSKLRVLALRVRDARRLRDRVPHSLLYRLFWLITESNWLSCIDYGRVALLHFLTLFDEARRRNQLFYAAFFLLFELELCLFLLLIFDFLIILTILSSDSLFYVCVPECGQQLVKTLLLPRQGLII